MYLKHVHFIYCQNSYNHRLWELAGEAYAEQLVDEGDVITGASYLVNIGKVCIWYVVLQYSCSSYLLTYA